MSSGSFIVAFITGHSIRGCTGLSTAQLAFQRSSAVGEARWLSWNFPYQATFTFPGSVSLLAASLSNICHALGSWRATHRARDRWRVMEAFSPHETIILAAGSCGLELLNNLQLPAELRARIHVFSYGPVSRSVPETASCVLVQGENDWVSRPFHRSVDHRIRCSHMGYLQHPETLKLFDDFCRRVLHPMNPS